MIKSQNLEFFIKAKQQRDPPKTFWSNAVYLSVALLGPQGHKKVLEKPQDQRFPTLKVGIGTYPLKAKLWGPHFRMFSMPICNWRHPRLQGPKKVREKPQVERFGKYSWNLDLLPKSKVIGGPNLGCFSFMQPFDWRLTNIKNGIGTYL